MFVILPWRPNAWSAGLPAVRGPRTVSRMRAVVRLAVVTALGLATAWAWIRLGLYGFGLPVGLVALSPLAMLGALYARSHRLADVGVLLGTFAVAWTAFEAWRWLDAASDPAVSIPGWTPIPLAAAVALLVVAVAVTTGASSHSR